MIHMDKIKRIEQLINESNELSLELFEYINNGVSEDDLQHIPEAILLMDRIDEIDIEMNALVEQRLEEINQEMNDRGVA